MQLDDWVLCRLYNKKNNWGKMAASSTEESEEAESLMTPESGIELPDFDEFVEAGFGREKEAAAAVPAIKEDYDWYSDLNLGDFQIPVVDFSIQDYNYLSFESPKPFAVSSLPSF